MVTIPPGLDVVAIGNAIVDVLAEATDALILELGLAKGTMAIVDEERAGAVYARMGPGIESSGGSAANTAVGVASLGGSAGFVGKVRDDQLGDVFAHDIRSAGVRFEVRPATVGPSTARCLVLVTADAERTMNTFLGASAHLAPGDIDPGFVALGGTVYLEGYQWDAEPAKAAMRVAVDSARAAGRRVAFTLSDPFCVDRHRGDFVDLIAGGVDVLFANEVELLSLFETESLDVALREAAALVDIAAVTLGERGSVVVERGGGRLEVPAFPVDAVIDTTGAGDLYAAGFLFGLARSADLDRCAELGGLCAAEVISHYGPRPLTSLALLADKAGLT